MKKLSLCLFILLILNYSYSIEISEETIFDYLVDVIKGLTESEEHQCDNLLIENKESFLKLMREFIQGMNEGKDMKSQVLPFGLRSLTIPNLTSKCQLMEILALYLKLTMKDGIKEIGSSLFYNTNKIIDLINKIKKGEENRMILIGQLLSLLLNFSLNK